MKNGQIWISAVLYMALGIVLLTLILAAGIPVVNKIKSKNTVLDTKEVMLTIDKNIRQVYREGPGSRRPIKIDIQKGSFIIDEVNDLITWDMESEFQLSQIGIPIQEGNLIILTETTSQEKVYKAILALNYTSILDLKLSSQVNEFSGINNFIITNIGSQNNNVPTISIQVF